MKTLIVVFVLGLSTAALAEDCSCLDQAVITDSCERFSYTQEADICFPVDPSAQQDERITKLEEQVSKLNTQVNRLNARTKKLAKK